MGLVGCLGEGWHAVSYHDSSESGRVGSSGSLPGFSRGGDGEESIDATG